MKTSEREKVWREGFEAEKHPGVRCPYLTHSGHTELWESGWAEGVMKRTGAQYDDKPPATGWRRLLKTFVWQFR
jgi:hypothetical protein